MPQKRLSGEQSLPLSFDNSESNEGNTLSYKALNTIQCGWNLEILHFAFINYEESDTTSVWWKKEIKLFSTKSTEQICDIGSQFIKK